MRKIFYPRVPFPPAFHHLLRLSSYPSILQMGAVCFVYSVCSYHLMAICGCWISSSEPIAVESRVCGVTR